MGKPSLKGRTVGGKFVKGEYKGGPGNPFAKRVNQLRAKILACITEEDIAALVEMMIEKGKAGDVVAAREVLDRSVGKPKQELDVNTTGDAPQFKVFVGIDESKV